MSLRAEEADGAPGVLLPDAPDGGIREDCRPSAARPVPANRLSGEERDRIVATYREHGHALLRGVPMGAIMAEMYGKREGCSRGRGGSMHLFDAPRRFYGGNAIVGGGLPLAVGFGQRVPVERRVA